MLRKLRTPFKRYDEKIFGIDLSEGSIGSLLRDCIGHEGDSKKSKPFDLGYLRLKSTKVLIVIFTILVLSKEGLDLCGLILPFGKWGHLAYKSNI